MTALREAVLPKARDLLASGVSSKFVSKCFRNDIPSRGLRFRVDNPAIGDRTAAELFFRLYERHELALIRNHMLRSRAVVELGAGIGVTGSHVLRRLDSDGRLISVEANKALHPILRRNLERHGSDRQIEIVHGAVSYSGKSEVRLQQFGEHMRSRIGSDPDLARTAAVPAVTLHGLVERFHLSHYVLISDIEGTEREVIEHDASGLASCDQAIIELHGTSSEISQMTQSLVALGFVLTARRKTIYAFTRGHLR